MSARTGLLAAFGSRVFALGFAAAAQPAEKTYRVALIIGASPTELI